jgi:hypothetical protein
MNPIRQAPGERQLTVAAHGHMLTNAGVWSPDGRWLVYDTRSAVDGSSFDGTRIERVCVESGRVELLYQSRNDACCGVVTSSPLDDRVVFILGPERPAAGWRYGPARRQGVVVRARRPGVAEPLDARDLVPPFTPGALRGGSHVHQFSGDGRLVSFTYEDVVLEAARGAGERNLRGVAVAVCDRGVTVPRTHPRNHDGTAFSVLVTELADEPPAGSDAITKAFEEAWIGTAGYLRPDGGRQRYALAFQGHVRSPPGDLVSEVFVVDLPDDPTSLEIAGERPLAGTPLTRPAPPRGVMQRRLTRTADRRHPGLQGPRHWLRSSPDGGSIACLLRDDDGRVQLYAVATADGRLRQVTRDAWDVASSFSWSPDGGRIAYVADGSVMTVDVATGRIRRLTPRTEGLHAPRPEACVFSPDGRMIAYMRTLDHNQLFVVDAG